MPTKAQLGMSFAESALEYLRRDESVSLRADAEYIQHLIFNSLTYQMGLCIPGLVLSGSQDYYYEWLSGRGGDLRVWY